MNQDSQENIPLLMAEELKKNIKAQQAIERLGKLEDWRILLDFVIYLKQLYMEEAFKTDNLEVLKRYKNTISGQESVARLPQLVEDLQQKKVKDDINTK